ncbi:MAG TPA: hypothetical protein VFB62_18960 [Polyangiaceae bacterium]|nr:hypothetical protein [Polyangiaceae bacterium]
MLAAVIAVGAVLISKRESPVGEAPPLTPLGTAAPEAVDDIRQGDPLPGALGPDAENPARVPEPIEPASAVQKKWRARQVQLDVHPLDVVFGPSGDTVLVSADDATLREYDLATGKLVHLASLPAQGDRIRLLHDRYVAVLRPPDTAHIPVMDIHNWDRDPMLLWIGLQPADIVALPDGKTAVAASSSGKRLSWFDLPTGRRLGDIRVPHVIRQLYVMRSTEGRPYIGALGTSHRAGRPIGAWIDLFDPHETPFGATRRSIAVGRDPRQGGLTRDQGTLWFVDYAANVASVLRIDPTTHLETITAGHGPVAAFLLGADRYGVTLDAKARTATVLDTKKKTAIATLMLEGEPHDGATSPDGSALFVSLGGTSWPPREQGAAVIAGDPPEVVATLKTGRGASRVAVAKSGMRAVVANYVDKALTVIEP